MHRMLPDSGLDFCCATSDVKFDSSRVFSAITVSAQYQEILQEFEEDGSCLITCQHIYSGIKLNISFEKEVNTSFTYFIRYAKRVAGFRPLYTIFRYFLKQNNIPSDNNHSMVLYLLVIFYLQMCVKWVFRVLFMQRKSGEHAALRPVCRLPDADLQTLDAVPRGAARLLLLPLRAVGGAEAGRASGPGVEGERATVPSRVRRWVVTSASRRSARAAPPSSSASSRRSATTDTSRRICSQTTRESRSRCRSPSSSPR